MMMVRWQTPRSSRNSLIGSVEIKIQCHNESTEGKERTADRRLEEKHLLKLYNEMRKELNSLEIEP